MRSAIDWERVEAEAVSFLRQLIRIDTTNPPGNESEAVDYAASILKAEGLTPAVVDAAPGRSNLVARLKGSGSGPSLLLDAHLDVVSAREGKWTVPPFSGDSRDGCIWGRGALDMKHMAAMSLAVFLTIHRQKVPLRGDLVLALTADEEAGAAAGAEFLVRSHPDLVRADYALGEVGGMTLHVRGHRVYPVQVAERGVCGIRLRFLGAAGHGSMPRKGAVPEKMRLALEAVSTLRFPARPHPAAREFLKTMAALSPGPERLVLSLLAAGRGASVLLDTLVPGSKSGPLKAMLCNTIQPTVVRCGDTPNVVPGEGEILLDGRILPGVAPEEMLHAVEKKVAGLADVAMVAGRRGTAIPADNPLMAVIRSVVQEMDPGAHVSPWLTPGFTNGAFYSSMGIKYLGFTPVMIPPTIEFASLFHAPDERIPEEGFKWGVQTLYKIVERFSGTSASGE